MSNTEPSTFAPWNNVDNTNEIETVQVDSLQEPENLLTDVLDTNIDITNKGDSNTEVNEQRLGHGCRVKISSTWLRSFVTDAIYNIHPSPTSLATSHTSSTPYPITYYDNYDKFSIHDRHFMAALNASTKPKSFVEAMKDDRWKQAMQTGIKELENNRTWTLESLPPDKKAMGSKWIYRIKYKFDGLVEWFKARLVILGNNQVEGCDYTETFAPVAMMVTVCTF